MKAGIYRAGGTPVEVQTIGVCDGVAMNHLGMKYSLASRELIADSVEVVARGHCFDAMVLMPNCDKIVPGMLMAAARLNIPSIVISGGPMLAGRLGERSLDVASVFEAVGAVKAGRMTEDELAEIEEKACPTCGSCGGHVYGQFHELPDRIAGHGIARQRHDSRGHERAREAGQADGITDPPSPGDGNHGA